MEKATLTNAAKSLNAAVFTNEEGKEIPLIAKKIKTVAVKGEDLERAFIEACNSIPEAQEDLIPDDVADVYNTLAKEMETKNKNTTPEAETKNKNTVSNNKESGVSDKKVKQSNSGGTVKSEVETMIKEGKFTSKEIVAAVSEKLSISSSSVSTIISDSKNPKYNKYEKLVKVGEDHKLYFEK